MLRNHLRDCFVALFSHRKSFHTPHVPTMTPKYRTMSFWCSCSLFRNFKQLSKHYFRFKPCRNNGEHNGTKAGKFSHPQPPSLRMLGHVRRNFTFSNEAETWIAVSLVRLALVLLQLTFHISWRSEKPRAKAQKAEISSRELLDCFSTNCYNYKFRPEGKIPNSSELIKSANSAHVHRPEDIFIDS